MEPFDLTSPMGRAKWDALAASGTELGIDSWCSQSLWGLAVHHAFSDPATDPGPAFGLEHEHGIAEFGRIETAEGAGALVPLDRVWGFATPVVAAAGHQRAVCVDLAAHLISDPTWKICVLTGVQENGALYDAIVDGFGRHLPLYTGEARVRCQASLEGGVDGYLSRRSREHRRNIRQAERHSPGLTYDIVDGAPTQHIVARLHAVEANSWKGRDGSGIESPDMARLYERLVVELSERAALRCVFVQLDGIDVGFILGGVLAGTYRGLQISFTENVRALGVGNLLQWHEVQRGCEEGLHAYDLGMDIAYKRRWAEVLFETTTVIAVRR